MEERKGRKQKRKMRKAYGRWWMITPLGSMENSKMSGEESPLGVCSHKIRPKI